MPITPTLVYDPAHRLHAPQVQFLDAALRGYYERPERIEEIRRRLGGAALPVDGPLSRAELERTHAPGLLDYLEQTCAAIEDDSYFYPSVFAPRPLRTQPNNPRRNHGFYAFDTDAPLGRHTWAAALRSASVAATAARLLLAEPSRPAYALCRPPGHHAGPDFYGGYCYLNNAAIAANRLRDAGPVAIIDIDYHHGNGTQAIFWDDPGVLFGSIHADPAWEYPYYAGFAEETGGPAAPGTTVNLPLPAGTAIDGYLAALDTLLERVAGFGPATVIVSAGFDTAASDPICDFALLPADYALIGARLRRLGRPTLFVQEGGYDIPSLGGLAERLLAGFAGA